MSKQEELEEKIREQRTIEANKKGLVGQTGKIGVVLKMLGSPIVSQSEGGTFVDTHYPSWTQEEIDENDPMNFPVMDLDGATRPEGDEWKNIPEAIPYGIQEIGYHFDGLSRGMHLEIKYDDLSTELSVTSGGYLVYKEIKGELVCYVPDEKWEGWIESLFKTAKSLLRKRKEEEFKQEVESVEKNKLSWWRQMKSRWGFDLT